MRLKTAPPKRGHVPFDAAGMDKIIRIMREAVPTQNDVTGEWTQGEPTLLMETYAAIIDMYGQEYWTARALQQATTVMFKVFYADALADLTAKDYIVWSGGIYDIQDPDNVGYVNDIIKIRAVIRT